MPAKTVQIHWPAGGVRRREAVQNQPPYTAYSALNVLNDAQGRERGGTRPGLARAISTRLVGPVLSLGNVTFYARSGDEIIGPPQTYLVAVDSTEHVLGGDGNLYAFDDTGTLIESFDSGAWNTNEVIQAAAHNQKLYFANHTVESLQSSTISYVPLVYNPAGEFEADRFHTWDDDITAGELPKGCPTICLWRDRLILAGGIANPSNLYGSRQGDPNDWDFSASDDSGAFSLQTTRAGVIGDTITCLSPHADNCLMVGCSDSLWLIVGDPRFGGTVKNLSNRVGPISKNAFAVTPDGLFVFLSRDGLWACAAGCQSLEAPVSVSRERLPVELRNIDVTNGDSGENGFIVSMEYDLYWRGIWIFLTPRNGSRTLHWFFDWETKSFWPISFHSAAFDPWVVTDRRNFASTHSRVYLGCSDGYLRRFQEDADEDDAAGSDSPTPPPSQWPVAWRSIPIREVPANANDATDIESYVILGPFGTQDLQNYLVWAEHNLIFSRASCRIDWEIYRGDTAEEAAAAAEAGQFPASRGWTQGGRSHTAYPRVRGAALYLKLKACRKAWAFEGGNLTMQDGGKVRV